MIDYGEHHNLITGLYADADAAEKRLSFVLDVIGDVERKLRDILEVSDLTIPMDDQLDRLTKLVAESAYFANLEETELSRTIDERDALENELAQICKAMTDKRILKNRP